MMDQQLEQRLKNLREAKLKSESERDKYKRRFKASRYRLRMARLALHAHPQTIRKHIHRYAQMSLKGKLRNRELIARMIQMEKDYDLLLQTVDTLKTKHGKQTCPKCKTPRDFDCFPRDPRKITGSDLGRCNVCEQKRFVSGSYYQRVYRKVKP